MSSNSKPSIFSEIQSMSANFCKLPAVNGTVAAVQPREWKEEVLSDETVRYVLI